MNGFKRYFLRITFALAIVTAVNTSCSDNFESSIPYVYVNINRAIINLNDLTVAGGYAVFPGEGYGGVVVFNTGIPDAEYIACDLTCPYEVDPEVLVEFDNSGIATCPKCGSTYNLWFGGTYESGPSKESLLPYSAFVSGGRLYVTN